jgi:FAD-dependent monooxygenase
VKLINSVSRPKFNLLVHFKSRDLSRLHRQGQFWHIFFLDPQGLGGAIIAQDEVDTWTIHLRLPLDTDETKIDSYDAIYRCLGGLNGKYEIKVDEILVRSTYRPSIAIARRYRGALGRIYLAGDAAHQNIPTGGYGMNMGLADAYDLGWKLAAVINGDGGSLLLDSYEMDRRPVAMETIEHSGVHTMTQVNSAKLLQPNASTVDEDSEGGRKMRKEIHDYYQVNDGENKSLGVEMGYRYKSSICIRDEDAAPEPDWHPSRYEPTTWPGSRAPHVFLNDGSAIFDHYGKHYTLIEFSDHSDRGGHLIRKAAEFSGVPLKHVELFNEEKALQLWERRLILVRPDGHVAWRSSKVADLATATQIVNIVSGKQPNTRSNGLERNVEDTVVKFTATSETTSQSSQYKLEKMGTFQS